MKLYFAEQLSSSTNCFDLLIQKNININILFSYFHHRVIEDKYLNILKKVTKNIILIDSGAFSVWSIGGKVNIKGYFEYLGKMNEIFKGRLIGINLDVIPGKFGVKPSKENINNACEESYENFKFLLKTGVNIMPVFHQHENFKYLDLYRKRKPVLLGISPANDMSQKNKHKFFNNVFYVTKNEIRTHGLAVTSIMSLKNYPFYSVDSASHRIRSKFGNYMKFENQKINIYHYKDKKAIIKNLKNNLAFLKGKTLYQSMMYLNILEFLKIEKYITDIWRKRNIIYTSLEKIL